LKILAVDTSQKNMTVAFYNGRDNILERISGEKNHSSLLLPSIDAALKKAGVGIGDIEAFLAVTGPGSFTGLRVGLATLKGLSFGREVPYITVRAEELAAYYETGRAEAFFEVLEKKAAARAFTPAADVELQYENPETKRFRY
jgi:tRNA threonylcarbamoyl adenosine modification protein YeaZ